MREIKFRAWNKELETMADNDNLKGALGSMLIATNYQGVERFIFMQYTGLKDKNGKEIYEGDIIYFNIDNGIGTEHYQGIVKWADNNPYSRFEYIIEYLDGGFDSLSRPCAYNENLEIQGNIYQHPELLEEK